MDMDGCCECCVLSGRGRTDRSSRGVLTIVVCLSAIMNPRQLRGLGQLGASGGGGA